MLTVTVHGMVARSYNSARARSPVKFAPPPTRPRPLPSGLTWRSTGRQTHVASNGTDLPEFVTNEHHGSMTTPDALSAGRYDLVVIGAGPAGEKGAAQAAYFGKRVVLIERAHVGGAVVHTGTLPSKSLRETALYLSGLRQRSLYGIEYTFGREITAEDLFYRQRLIERSHLDLVSENIAHHGINLIEGVARVEDPHVVAVTAASGEVLRLSADYILIATGSRPVRPHDIAFDGERIYDTDSILNLHRIPRSMVVIGAGVIGSEYATLFAALGVAITLVDRDARLLPFLDPELSGILLQQMRGMGIDVLFERRMDGIDWDGAEGVRVRLTDGTVLQAEAVLYCGGRQGAVAGLGLADVGIATDERGRISVDEHYQTAVPNIYAVGDVIGFPALASTSMEQARVAVCHAFSFDYKKQVSTLIPYGLYTIPEISMVGESEASLQRQRRSYLVGRAYYRNNARGQITGDTSGMIKLIFDPETRAILGIHIIGERACELIHIGQMAMQYSGTIDIFIESVFNFPTFADAYKYAAYAALQTLQRWRDHPSEQ
jgi:NAD(P) transhydrogenase